MAISRAFSSLADFVALSGHLVAEGGALYAMKGVDPVDEVAALPAGWAVAETMRSRCRGWAPSVICWSSGGRDTAGPETRRACCIAALKYSRFAPCVRAFQPEQPEPTWPRYSASPTRRAGWARPPPASISPPHCTRPGARAADRPRSAGQRHHGQRVDKRDLKSSVYHLLVGMVDSPGCGWPLPTGGYDVLPATGPRRRRGRADQPRPAREAPAQRARRLRRRLRLRPHRLPPSLSMLTLNGLCCATGVIIPMQCEYYALEGFPTWSTRSRRCMPTSTATSRSSACCG